MLKTKLLNNQAFLSRQWHFLLLNLTLLKDNGTNLKVNTIWMFSESNPSLWFEGRKRHTETSAKFWSYKKRNFGEVSRN